MSKVPKVEILFHLLLLLNTKRHLKALNRNTVFYVEAHELRRTAQDARNNDSFDQWVKTDSLGPFDYMIPVFCVGTSDIN